MGSSDIRLTKALHCLLYNSGIVQKWHMWNCVPLKYVLIKIQAPLATPFFCILSFWIHVFVSREERGAMFCVYGTCTRQEAGAGVAALCDEFSHGPPTALPSAPSAAQEKHICLSMSYPLIKHFSFPEKGKALISWVSWGISSTQTVRPC